MGKVDRQILRRGQVISRVEVDLVSVSGEFGCWVLISGEFGRWLFVGF